MHRRPYRKAAAVTALALLAAGCVQATRHSNTMYFGTNTTFGIKAGAATGETPKVIVGYDRQEAVILPLVANTAETALRLPTVSSHATLTRRSLPIRTNMLFIPVLWSRSTAPRWTATRCLPALEPISTDRWTAQGLAQKAAWPNILQPA